MSKITFRADDDLVDAVEDLDESKSDVMRNALRAYLESEGALKDFEGGASADSIEEAVAERVDELVERRLDARQSRERDVNVRISVEPGEGFRAADGRTADGDARRKQAEPTDRGRRGNGGLEQSTSDASAPSCVQCGESLSEDHVYCPNCGEKATRRVFCECGDEVRADWAFCPHCGRRTASADALER